MLTRVRAGGYTIAGVSVGGIYTSLHVPEFDLMFDCGLAPRSFAGAKALLLSHGHGDHAGALATLLGQRILTCGNRRLRILLPAAIAGAVEQVLDVVATLQRKRAEVELVPLEPGDEVPLHSDLYVRALRTFHPVPSLGYLVVRRVNKLRPEFVGLDGAEIRRRREAGEALFHPYEHLELAYVTDTLARVLDAHPELFAVKTLVLECTFLDAEKPPEKARASGHIHLDDLLPHADRFANEALVLMHFSQGYSPAEVRSILAARCPPAMRDRLVVFAPDTRGWPG